MKNDSNVNSHVGKLLLRADGKMLPARTRPIVRIATVVALMAGAFEVFVWSASRAWVTPDSTAYISLAIGLAERFDWSQELFAFRLPGYPALLAVLFRFFGPDSPMIILAVQHAMVAGCAVLSVAIAWTLRPNRLFCSIVGVLSVASLHLSGYANAILTETLYTVLLTLCMFLLVRHVVHGRFVTLVSASVIASGAVLTKDVGQLLIPACAAAGMMRAWSNPTKNPNVAMNNAPSTVVTRIRRALASLPISILPAIILLLPWLANNYQTFGKAQLTANGGMMLYLRAGCLEGLDSPSSPAVAEIRAAVARAKTKGQLEASATQHDYLSAVRACLTEYEPNAALFASRAMNEVSALFHRAGMDLIREHPWRVAKGTIVDAYRMVMVPDNAHRMLPGAPTISGRMDPNALTYGVDTYAASVLVRVGGNVNNYVSFSNEPTSTTPALSSIVEWYHHRIERGAPLLGLVDSPYEELALLWVLGAGCSLALPWRTAWFLIHLVIAGHVLGAAFCGGVQPRYAVPLQPLTHVLSAVPIAMGVSGLASAYCRMRTYVLASRDAATKRSLVGFKLPTADAPLD